MKIILVGCRTTIMALRIPMTRMSSVMGTAFNTGPMVRIMRANGTIIRLKETEYFGMQRVMCIKENSRMIWPMGMESTLISMEASIKVNSKMMFKRAMAKKSG